MGFDYSALFGPHVRRRCRHRLHKQQNRRPFYSYRRLVHVKLTGFWWRPRSFTKIKKINKNLTAYWKNKVYSENASHCSSIFYHRCWTCRKDDAKRVKRPNPNTYDYTIYVSLDFSVHPHAPKIDLVTTSRITFALHYGRYTTVFHRRRLPRSRHVVR